MTNKLVIILGMHRSGTSALTKLLVEMGFDAGNSLMPSGEDNPFGFWEDIEVVQLNNEILSSLFLSWDEIENYSERKVDLFNDMVWEGFHKKAITIIESKFEKSNLVVIKDPRFTILLPFWNMVFNNIEPQVYYILTIRNPLSVAKSLRARNGFAVQKSLLLWYHYNISALSDSVQQMSIISYEDLMAHPKNILNKIIGFTALHQEFDQPQIEKVLHSSVKQNLEHHQSTNDDLQPVSSFFPLIIRLWDTLVRLSKNGETNFSQSALEDYLKVYPDSFLIKEVDDVYTSTLHCIGPGMKEPNVVVIKKHGQGKIKLKFELDETQVYNEFYLYLCDKPCYINVESIAFNDTIGIVTFGGNYVYNSKLNYFFSSHSPFIHIKLAVSRKAEYLELMATVQILNNDKKRLLLPILNNECNTLRKQNGFLVTDKNKLEELLNNQAQRTDQIQNEKLKLQTLIEKNESTVTELLKNQALKVDQTQNEKLELQYLINQQELEIGRYQTGLKKQKILDTKQKADASQYLEKVRILEKKSQWLYDERKTMLNSLSWKITYPFRWGMAIARRAHSFVFLLGSDIKTGISILKRDGISTYFYRLYWYLRGKRLKEDIDIFKKNQQTTISSVEDIDTTTPIELPNYEKPLVSIIIPVHNQWNYTYNCLKSIKKHTTDVHYEVIVADDKSTDSTTNILNVIQNIKLIRNEENIGFLLNCKKAARKAKGKYLHFLNNDTQVHPGWLSALVNLISSSELIGIVGSKLVYPDGQLQEAGGIVWNDASGWNYGRLDNPEKSEYNYVKEVDYISGASLMIRKSDWDNIGGFDERYSPAYYEDTDLAYSIRKIGLKVMYQPLSVVTHFEGISNGKNETSGIKKYQVDNRVKFLNKWNVVLNDEASPNAKNAFLHRDRSAQKKQMLIIDHYVPHFDQDAGSRSTFSYIKLFVEMGFSVSFIGDNFYRHQPYTEKLQQLGVEVLYGDYYQKNITEWLKINGQYFDYVIAHRMHIAPKYFELLKKHSNAKLAYVGHDLQFVSSKRKYEFTKDESHKIDSERFKQIETKIFNDVDIIFPFSTYETPYIQEIVPDKIVQTIPVYFYDDIPKSVPGFNERRDILFIGFFGHPPNADAIVWFVRAIFPIVQKDIPNIKLYIVGSKPTEEVKSLACDSIKVTGFVSDAELQQFYQRCRIAILPLRFGAGVKGKLLESLYYQLPSVITSVAAEGVPEIDKYALIADEAKAFAQNIQRLYLDKKVWNEYSEKGKELIKKHYTADTVRGIMNDVLKK